MNFLQDFIVIVVFLSCGQFMDTGSIDCLSFLFCLVLRRILCPCFDHVSPFQALHHCFVCLLKHLASLSQCEKVYSLEITAFNVRRGLSICFWEGKELLTMTVAHCGRDVPAVRNCVLLCSQVLIAVSSEPTIICCAGGSADFIKALDNAPSQKAGSQYPFKLLPLQIVKLMHKPSFSVMERIDMFSMFRTLLVRLSGLLDEKWTESTQYFRKVR